MEGACPLGQLAARAAAARATAAAAAAGQQGGGSSDGDTDGGGGQAADAVAELRSLQLEARDALQALLGRMRELGSLRRSLLRAQQGQQLGRLAAVGQDAAPRAAPLLRQLVGELAVGLCIDCTGALLHVRL